MPGFVSIVGAGPWDPTLLTLAARERLRRADVVIADYLVNPAVLLHCRADVVVHRREAGPRHGTWLEQDAVNALMVEEAARGRRVVRIKGGDPCMFGRGGEEATHLVRAGIPFEMVPGVTSPVAAPECAGIPVTHRDHTPAVTFVSGWEAYEKAGLAVAWEHLARSAGTIVLMMSVGHARDNVRKLIESGRDAATPAAVVRWGSRGIQRTITGTLDDIADRVEAAGIRAPAVMVVGEVVGLRDEIAWLERRPLFSRRVLVTRARDQALALIHALTEAGADAVALPCLALEPPVDPAAVHGALRRVPAEFDGVLVSSPAGARALGEALARLGRDARLFHGKRIAAVGPGTAAALRERGLMPDLVSATPRSEGVVEILRDADLLGARWLHFRGDEGRDTVASAVADAGGRYELAIAYRVVRPPFDPATVRSLLPAGEGGEDLDAIVLASGRTAELLIEGLAELLGPERSRALLERARIVSLGPVTTASIERLGLRVAATATEPTDAAVIAATIDALA